MEREVEEQSLAKAAASSYCPECEGLISLVIKGKQHLLREFLSGDIREEDYAYHEADLTLDAHYPQAYSTSLSASIPKQIRQVFPDMVEDAARRRNSAAVLTSCRGVMEVALQELESKSGSVPSKSTLIRRIDDLVLKGIITSDLAEWAHQIRLDGNRSAHELVGDPTTARAYVDFLKLFLEVSFDLPARIKAMKSLREAPAAPPKVKGKPG